MYYYQHLLSLLLSCVLWNIQLTNASKVLQVMHLSSTSSLSSINMPLIVDFAFHLANNKSDLLPGYTIHSTVSYAEPQNVGQSVKSFIEQISRPPTKIAILGPFYTSQAKVVAETASYYNLVEVAYSVTAPIMSNREKYPYFSRVIESTALHNPAILKILKFYNWNKIATIAQDSEFVMGAKDDLEGMVLEKNMTILASATYHNDITPQLIQIKESKAKIIIAFFRGGDVMCKIYKAGLFGPRYQLINWSRRFGVDLSQLNQNTDKSCTLEQTRQAAEGMIYFHPITLSVEDMGNKTIYSTGSTYEELLQQYKKYVTRKSVERNQSLSTGFFSFTFDAAWALVLGLNASLEELKLMGETLEGFSYEKKNVTEVIYRNLKAQQYFGPSGEISFNSKADRINKIVIYQIQNSQEVAIGYYDPILDLITWIPGHSITFQGVHPPYDSDVTVLKELTINDIMVVIMTTLAVLGLVYCVLSVAVAFKYRNTKLIKLSSPRINALIAVGCAVGYIDIILFGLDSVDVEAREWICSTRVWLLVSAFTFAFGSMFSKTWRVHVLFTNKKLQRKIVKDFHLVIFVLVILAFDVVLLCLWQAIDPPHWKKVDLYDEREEADPDVIVRTFTRTCSSKYSTYWLGSIYVFKGLLLIFGIFFAWETRKVRIEALNDSKQIGISVYNVMVMSVISVPLVNLLSVEQLSIIFGITTISILVCATATMTLVYGSKIYLIMVHGNKVDDVTVQLPFQSTLKDRQTTINTQAEQSVSGYHDNGNMSTLRVPDSKQKTATATNDLHVSVVTE